MMPPFPWAALYAALLFPSLAAAHERQPPQGPTDRPSPPTRSNRAVAPDEPPPPAAAPRPPVTVEPLDAPPARRPVRFNGPYTDT